MEFLNKISSISMSGESGFDERGFISTGEIFIVHTVTFSNAEVHSLLVTCKSGSDSRYGRKVRSSFTSAHP